MKTHPSAIIRRLLTLAGSLGLAAALCAQSAKTGGRPLPVEEERPTIPSADKLQLFGLAFSAAEAGPLLDQYASEQEQLFQERRAVLASMQGRTPAEQMKIWQTLIATQRERLGRHRELEQHISAMLKQERERHLPRKDGNGS